MQSRLIFLAILLVPMVLLGDYAEEETRRQQNEDLRLQRQNRDLQDQDFRLQERSQDRINDERRIEQQNDAEIRRDQLEFERLNK